MSEEKMYRIVLLGDSEAGKSSLANIILGEDIFKVDNTECQTESKSVHGRRITLINTPDFSDPGRSEEELKTDILRCITECTPGPHAFVIVLKVEKSTEQQQQAVIEKISQYFSEEVFKYAAVVFTEDGPDSGEMKIKEFIDQNKYLRDLMKKFKSQYHLYNQQGDNISNQSKVAELLNTIDQILKENKGEFDINKMLPQGDPCNKANSSGLWDRLSNFARPAAELVANAFFKPTPGTTTETEDESNELERETEQAGKGKAEEKTKETEKHEEPNETGKEIEKKQAALDAKKEGLQKEPKKGKNKTKQLVSNGLDMLTALFGIFLAGVVLGDRVAFTIGVIIAILIVAWMMPKINNLQEWVMKDTSKVPEWVMQEKNKWVIQNLSIIVEWVIKEVSKLAEWLKQKLSNWATQNMIKVAEWVMQKVSKVLEWLMEKTNNIAEHVIKKVRKWVMEKINKVVEGAMQKIRKVTELVMPKIHKVAEAVMPKMSKVAEVGGGLVSNVGALFGSFLGLGGTILGGGAAITEVLKTALQIASDISADDSLQEEHPQESPPLDG
ncbi:protein MPAN [Sarotherodon galilaeus]